MYGKSVALRTKFLRQCLSARAKDMSKVALARQRDRKSLRRHDAETFGREESRSDAQL